MNTITRVAAVALLAGFTQLAAAQGSVAAELSQTVSPNIHSDTGSSASRFVWVKRIEERDRAGLLRVLFNDLEGALLPVDQLSQIDRLINAEDARNHGHYHEAKNGLQLQAAKGAQLALLDP